MYILRFISALLRKICISIDAVAYSLVDNAYNLIVAFSKGTLVSNEIVKTLTHRMYFVVAIFALFRVAIFLVNSIIEPIF